MYEVYPQSFLDTNADGIGDLAGIIAKLDYIHGLGCNLLWVNPCFESPFRDAGYDVSDFRKVAGRYGTNEDMQELFKQAHRRGIRVMLDLVAGHTSIDHQWFKESSRHEANGLAGRYVWTGNWLECEKGFVNGHAERNGTYMSNFFWHQPALNYGYYEPDADCPWQLPMDHPDCKATLEELKGIMRFWLDMGCDGFRVDMASSLVKNDPDKKGITALWADVRSMLDADYPNAAIIAEWSDPEVSIPAGFHMDFMLHCDSDEYTTLFRAEPGRNVLFDDMGRSFFDADGAGDICRFIEPYLKHLSATRGLGYISIPSGNHDLPRLAMGRDEDQLRLAFVFLLTMPGVPAIYAGDEIGMRYIENLPSKEGGYSRTGSRTPMQWDDSPNAGFSTGTSEDLYLPIDADPGKPTVARQEADSKSLLNFIRRLISLRHENAALAGDGEFEVIHARKGELPFVYARRDGDDRIVVAINPGRDAVETSIELACASDTPQALIETACSLTPDCESANLTMPGQSSAIWRV